MELFKRPETGEYKEPGVLERIIRRLLAHGAKEPGDRWNARIITTGQYVKQTHPEIPGETQEGKKRRAGGNLVGRVALHEGEILNL